MYNKPRLHYRSFDSMYNKCTSEKNLSELDYYIKKKDEKQKNVIPIEKELFNFSKPFSKLQWAKFTTIRSVNYAKKHDVKIGDIGWITLNKKRIRKVKLVNWKDMAIQDIPFELLEKDVRPEQISSHEEFCQKLNKLYADIGIPYANNSLTTVKRIFILEGI